MAFEHQGVDSFLLLSKWAECDGASDIGGAIKVLGSAIKQQEAFGLKWDICIWRSLVVNDGAMSLITRDGIKRDIAI